MTVTLVVATGRVRLIKKGWERTVPPTADTAVRRFQTYLSCQAMTNLRIFPVVLEIRENFDAPAVLAECERETERQREGETEGFITPHSLIPSFPHSLRPSVLPPEFVASPKNRPREALRSAGSLIDRSLADCD